MNRSESIKELAAALAKAQALFPEIPRDKTVTVTTKTGREYSYKYAELSSIVNATRKPLTENGLSFTQEIVETEKGMSCLTVLMHSSGEWKSSLTPMILKENDMQGMGGALTFSRRYGLSALIGVATEEDTDGDGAGRGNAPKNNGNQRQQNFNNKPAAQKSSVTKPETQRTEPTSADDESILDYIDKPLTAMEKVELSKWKMPGGKFKDKKLGEVQQDEIIAYYQELKLAESSGQPLSDGHKMLMKKFAQYYSDLI